MTKCSASVPISPVKSSIQTEYGEISPSYVPKPGDVVDYGDHLKALVYLDKSRHNSNEIDELVTVNADGYWGELKYKKNLRKIGEVNIIGRLSTVEARDIAKAYFAQEQESEYVVAWGGIRLGLAYRNNLSRMWYVCNIDCHFENMIENPAKMVILEPSDIKPEDATKDELRALIRKYDMFTGKLK